MTTVLKRGSKGAAVRDLQTCLNKALVQPIHVDGDFGEATEGAVRVFQVLVGLVVDGIAGRQTIAALKQAIAAPKPGRPEPDKTAMAQPAPVSPPVAHSVAAAPPRNVASLQLLATARPIDEIIWHCAATAEGKDFTVADIRAWHKQRGFSDVGYHYIIYRDGRIMLGRPIGQIGAHCADGGKNRGTIGCCYIGGVAADGKTPKDTRTPAQRASMLWLTQQLIERYPAIRKVTGHREYAAKACPSFDVRKDELGRLI
jgi:N-acetylmuramoyl-L-alanine amidase